jgi:uncharacterized protein YegL
VYGLALGDHPAVDGVAATGIEVPRLVRAGREVSVGARVFATREGPVVLHVSRDGTEVLTRTLNAPVGTSLHDVQVTMPDEGVHELSVRVERENDPIAENNLWSTLVRVVSPPRVLLVHELTTGEPALATVFRDARLSVDVARAEGVPGDVPGFDRYQLVVLDELVLTSLSETQQRALRAWVEQRGGGLITTTGMHGVGREPEVLREIEPIEPPRAIPEPRPIELIIVIDRSGSMMGPNIVNARNAGIAAVRALRPDSRVGVVAFSGSADLVVPPVPVARAEEVTRAIAGIRASGGTDLAAALTAATSIVSNDDRYLRHVILMSDGESRAPPAIAAAQALRETGASITAITLGPRVQLMSDIARIGRGRYHVTARSTSLPSLFVREAQFRSAPPAREVAFRPTVRARMAFMNDYDPAADPPLLGYTQSAARRGALTLLGAPESAPLLAHWFVGPGQVASFTSSTSSRWADTWRTGPGFRRLFGQMAWEMLRPQSDDNLELHLSDVEGRRGVRRVTVVAPGVASEVVPIVTLSRGRDAGVRLDLRPAAPGVWTSHVTLERGFVVDARLPASREPCVAVSDEAPYPAELRALGTDMATLDAVTRLGGGRVVTSVDAALNDVAPERVMRDARLPLLLGAWLAYLVGVAALRVSFRRGVRLRRGTP